MRLQKLGGYASICLILLGAIFAIAMYVYPGLPGSLTTADLFNPDKLLAFQAESPSAFSNLALGVHLSSILGGILILLIALALRERMQAAAPNLVLLSVIAFSAFAALSITTAIVGNLVHTSMASARDVSAYRALLVVLYGLSAAADHALGWGFLLIGWVGVRSRLLPRILGCLILALGVLLIFSFAATNLGTVNTVLGFISLIWLGIVLLRKQTA